MFRYNPKDKPPTGTPIDQSHPLADRLIFAHLFNEGAGSRVLNHAPNDRYHGTVLSPGAWAPGVGIQNLTGSSTPAYTFTNIDEVRASVTSLSYFTMVFRLKTQAVVSQYVVYHGDGNSGTGTTQYVCRYVNTSLTYYFGQTSSFRTLTISDARSVDNWTAIGATWESASGTVAGKCYLNGQRVGVIASAAGNGPINSANTACGGAKSGYFYVALHYCWLRTLSPGEMDWVAHAPFDMFRRTQRFWPVWANIAAGPERIGNASLTQDAFAFLGAGTGTVSGSSSVSEAAQSLAASSTALISGSLSKEQAANTASMAGGVLVSGLSTVTQSPDTISVTGGATVGGSLSQSQDSEALSSAGVLLVAGSGNAVHSSDETLGGGAAFVYGDLLQNKDDQSLDSSGGVLVVGRFVTGPKNPATADVLYDILREKPATGWTFVGGSALAIQTQVLSSSGELWIFGESWLPEDDCTLWPATVGGVGIAGESFTILASDELLSGGRVGWSGKVLARVGIAVSVAAQANGLAAIRAVSRVEARTESECGGMPAVTAFVAITPRTEGEGGNV